MKTLTSTLKTTANNGTGIFGKITDPKILNLDGFIRNDISRFNSQSSINFLHEITKKPINNFLVKPKTFHDLRYCEVTVNTLEGSHKTELLMCKSTYEYLDMLLHGYRLRQAPILTGEEDYWTFREEDFGLTMFQIQLEYGNKPTINYEPIRKSKQKYVYAYTEFLMGIISYRIEWDKLLDGILNEHNLIDRRYL